MHELGIMTSVMEVVNRTAAAHGADRVLKVSLSVGVMTEAVEDALRFAFEVLTERGVAEGAELAITMVEPKSRCDECGTEFVHNRFQRRCPQCDNPFTTLIAGRELSIDSIEIDIPDDDSVRNDDPIPNKNHDGPWACIG